MNLKIATRKSKLALIQADWVMNKVMEKHGVCSEKLLIKTEGDKRLDVSLDKIGGKGIFVKDIEMAIADGRADAAVHSMKDVPYEINEAFEIAAIPTREDARDAFISMNGISFFELRKGAKIGTSSNRRSALVKLLRPDIVTVSIRGNVQTRISKIESEDLDGIILASAGLKRLDMESIITDYFDPHEFIPAVGQGALGIEVLSKGQHAEIFRSLNDRDIRICVEAERSFMRRLDGGCHSSLGAYAELEGDLMHIVGIFSVGGRLVKKDIMGPSERYLELGRDLAERVLLG
ncbi:hydroxymethylbilane synthase [Clostridium sp.]|uniref:hydroxymethylbilane synthase n=1 Tax=Clostridium sp. TaxID=1506 RepID=UPI003F4AFFC1